MPDRQGGCGATYGVVPFVSRRSTGIVCGLVSAGGASGGVINQAIFFLNTPAHGSYGARTLAAGLHFPAVDSTCCVSCCLAVHRHAQKGSCGGVGRAFATVRSFVSVGLARPHALPCPPVNSQRWLYPRCALRGGGVHVSRATGITEHMRADAPPDDALCFSCPPAVLAPHDSFKWLGCVICAVAAFGVAPIYFPMWGGLIFPPVKGATEVIGPRPSLGLLHACQPACRDCRHRMCQPALTLRVGGASHNPAGSQAALDAILRDRAQCTVLGSGGCWFQYLPITRHTPLKQLLPP